jgi:hypothetical protein
VITQAVMNSKCMLVESSYRVQSAVGVLCVNDEFAFFLVS